MALKSNRGKKTPKMGASAETMLMMAAVRKQASAAMKVPSRSRGGQPPCHERSTGSNCCLAFLPVWRL